MFSGKVINLLAFAGLIAICGVQSADAVCELSDDDIRKINATIIYKVRNSLELLRTNSVPSDADLHFICEDRSVQSIKCQSDGSFDKPPPTRFCHKGLRAIIEEQTINRDPSCPAGNTDYSVTYKYSGGSFELYRVCFNPQSKSPVFVRHHLYLGTSGVTTRPIDQEFTTDRIVTRKEVAAYTQSSVYRAFLSLVGPNYVNNTRTSVIQRGHLAPSGDFMYINHMRDSFKFINIVPQFGSINNKNWKILEENIRDGALGTRKRPRDDPSYLTIVTGVIDILELESHSNSTLNSTHKANDSTTQTNLTNLAPLKRKRNFKKARSFSRNHVSTWNHTSTYNTTKQKKMVKMFLEPSSLILPVPKWMYKIVSVNGNCTVFVTYNNIFNKPRPSPTPICPTTTCPIHFRANRSSGETYCCDLKHFPNFQNLMPHGNICN